MLRTAQEVRSGRSSNSNRRTWLDAALHSIWSDLRPAIKLANWNKPQRICRLYSDEYSMVVVDKWICRFFFFWPYFFLRVIRQSTRNDFSCWMSWHSRIIIGQTLKRRVRRNFGSSMNHWFYSWCVLIYLLGYIQTYSFEVIHVIGGEIFDADVTYIHWCW